MDKSKGSVRCLLNRQDLWLVSLLPKTKMKCQQQHHVTTARPTKAEPVHISRSKKAALQLDD